MSSRNIIIAVIIVVLVIIGVGLYFLFAPAATPSITGQAGQTGSLPATGNQSNPGGAIAGTGSGMSSSTGTNATLGKNFGIISNEPILAYFVSPTNVVTAIEPDGKIVQVTNGQVSVLNALQVQGIMSASFSYDGAKILANFGDPSNPQTSVFDISTKAWTPMAAGLQSPVWSPSDYRIAYVTSEAGVESFGTFDASKAKPTPTVLTTLAAQDLAIAWPNKTQIMLYTKPSAYLSGSAWSFDTQKNTLMPIAIEAPGLEALWNTAPASAAAPLGLEFSIGGSGLGGSDALVDHSGNILQQLKFLTLPTKCLFSSATSTVSVSVGSSTQSVATSTSYLFCGVPRDQSNLAYAHLPDDYNEMALFTADDIYRIDLQTGDIATVFNDQNQSLDVSNVEFENNTLFFVNRYDQKLYAISLGA